MFPRRQILLSLLALQPAPWTLSSRAARLAFRGWFTWLAEAVAWMPAAARPRDITDCSALLRFAFREALRRHDAAWARPLNLTLLPAWPDVPRSEVPSSGALFRTAAPELQHFADAEHLMRLNTHPTGLPVEHAEPGDILFYKQLEPHQPWHSMICLGRSQFESSPEKWTVYHTGPIGDTPGEIRRPSVSELLHHPEPRWRPVPGNSNFLGVRRWNILGTQA